MDVVVDGFPDITDLRGIHASLDLIESWLFAHFPSHYLVPIDVDVDSLA